MRRSQEGSRRFDYCFNPRTRMGCDIRMICRFENDICFNPRTRMGCDCADDEPCDDYKVSIHAPAWGATFFCFLKRAISNVSIHAPAWGATCNRRSTNEYWKFQSTHPHGVRQGQWRWQNKPTKFQSTHPHGVRLKAIKEFTPEDWVSIHAPAWGATIVQGQTN